MGQAGYWQGNIWADHYWHPDYWFDQGTAIPTLPERELRLARLKGFDFETKQRFPFIISRHDMGDMLIESHQKIYSSDSTERRFLEEATNKPITEVSRVHRYTVQSNARSPEIAARRHSFAYESLNKLSVRTHKAGDFERED